MPTVCQAFCSVNKYKERATVTENVPQENTLVIANTFFQQHKRRLYM